MVKENHWNNYLEQPEARNLNRIKVYTSQLDFTYRYFLLKQKLVRALGFYHGKHMHNYSHKILNKYT
jgi:hypothetical protein